MKAAVQSSIAIVGYEARLPGAPDAAAAFDVLREGRCTVTEVPEQRWSSQRFLDPTGTTPGRSYTRAAGILDDIWSFDANYFGLSAREAEQMDPQQRILLEVTAKAFDHAGIDPAQLDRDRVGVYIGASSSDHSMGVLQDTSVIEQHFMLGNTASILANRISYQWDFHGPSLTLDTACSSGLFALDQAVQAISAGHIDTAIVGGVHLLLSPLPFVGFSRAGMLSKSGLCQPFAKGADGYVRAEGCVVFVLQRGDLARQSGLKLRSFVQGTGTNTSGRSGGIAIPSAARQVAMMRRVMAKHQVQAEDVVYAEAHGTGTAVGDPIEARALGETYGAGRGEPLPIGSSKSNFGHLEPVSGLVGLLKAQFVLETGMIPASLHASDLNPDIDFDALNLSVVRQPQVLAESARARLAVVNSFGFGGANAHAVLREAADAPVAAVDMPPALLVTAQSDTALEASLRDWQALAQAAPADLPALVANANWNQARHKHRLVLAARSAEDLSSEIDLVLQRQHIDNHPAATLAQNAPVAFVFSGNGAVWDGMARHNFLTDAVFRHSFTALSNLCLALNGPDLVSLLMTPQSDEILARADIAQPLHFAVQLALVDALAAQGVKPQACLGHSLGEVAAAVTSGRLSRDEGLKIVLRRGRAFEPIFGQGGMAVLAASREEAEALIDQSGLPLDLAADNAPAQVTISGPVTALDDFLLFARQKRIAGKRLRLPYPYHSRLIETLKAPLTASLCDIRGQGVEQADFYSGWLGQKLDGRALDGEYWWQNARQSVEFRQGVQALLDDGYRLFLEISPHSVVKTYLRDCIEHFGVPAQVHESLDKSKPALRSASAIARRLLAAGGNVDEIRILGRRQVFTTAPPHARFERHEFQLAAGGGPDILARAPVHPLLGARSDPAAWVWTSSLSLARQPWLADHKVLGRVLFPAAATVELFRAAAVEALGCAAELRDLEFLRPLDLSETAETPIRTRWEPAARRLTLETGDVRDPQIVAVCRAFEASGATGGQLGHKAEVAAAGLYDQLRALGLDYGPAFARLIVAERQGAVMALALDGQTAPEGMVLDPTALDACFHGLVSLVESEGVPLSQPMVPVRLGRLRHYTEGVVSRAELRLVRLGPEGAEVTLRLGDAEGRVLAEIDGLRFKPLPDLRDKSPLAWREIMVPLAGQGMSGLPEFVEALRRSADAVPSDGDVLRAALAARLAFDLAKRELAGQGRDERFDLALNWLTDAGIATVAEDGTPELPETCPWPGFDELTTLFGQLDEDIQDDLFAALNAASGTPPIRLSQRRIHDAALSAISALTLPAHILVAGEVSDGLLAALCGDDRLVSVAARNDAEAEVLSLRLSPRPGLRFVALDDPALGQSFDLVVGIGLSQSSLVQETGRIAGLLCPNGVALLFEELPDLFALMTGRHLRANTHQILGDSFDAQGVALSVCPLAARESLVLLSGLKTHSAAPVSAVKRIMVDPEADLADGSLADLFRDLPEGTIWLHATNPDQFAQLTGWRRTLVNETGRDLRVLVADATVPDGQINAVLATTCETEILFSKGGAFAPRLVPVAPTPAAKPGDRLRLQTRRRTPAFDQMAWVSEARVAPKPGEVEIEIAATGLNFRDVMWAQGLLPAEALERGFAGLGCGMECSGTVVTAPEGSRFRLGQNVLAFAPQAFASHVTVPETVVLALPESIDVVQAAALPVIFLTADYALSELARLQPGETLLVHGAAGGVGLAALQIAQRLGAKVIATAGTVAKRRYLQALGIEDVFDSRSSDFEDQVRTVTNGRGVDVVLNALAGEALERGIACLAPFGRFVELGKRDIYGNSLIALRALRDNISFFAVDADQLLAYRPEVAQRIMARIALQLAEGTLTPPPIAVFGADDIREAFLLMQRSGHIGKVVVTAPVLPPVSVQPATVDLTGTWVVTGGTSGFGLASAEFLARNGASVLWLVSRRAELSTEEQARLKGLGVDLHLCAADVTDEVAMEQIAARIAASGQVLAGAIHAAALYDDAPFEALDAARIRAVFAAKVQGASVLAQVLAPLSPRHLWFYSSVSARFGNPGQSAYVAANREIEALAARLARDGLNTRSIAWGPIADCGILARDAGLRQHLSDRLGPLLGANEALEAFLTQLPASQPGATLTIARMNWSRLSGDVAVLKEPLFAAIAMQKHGGAVQDLGQMISSLGEKAARAKVLEIILGEAARVLRIAPGDIDPKRPLADLGFDSLMAMSLKVATEERLGADLPMGGLSADLTPARLVHEMFARFAKPASEDLVDDMSRVYLSETSVSTEMQDAVRSRVEQGAARQ